MEEGLKLMENTPHFQKRPLAIFLFTMVMAKWWLFSVRLKTAAILIYVRRKTTTSEIIRNVEPSGSN